MAKSAQLQAAGNQIADHLRTCEVCRDGTVSYVGCPDLKQLDEAAFALYEREAQSAQPMPFDSTS